MDWIKDLKFDDKGLIPAIIQDVDNGDVLMLGYMNKESIKKTVETGKVIFFSRSRQKLWVKGETSGHTQHVKEIFFDCDKDTLLIKVDQKVAACHEGYRTCFFRKVVDGRVEVIGKKIF